MAVAIYSGFQPHEVQADRCPMPTEAYALCPISNPQAYLIEQRSGYIATVKAVRMF
ncbi:MAG: hypothetical protein WBL95_01980 [Microcoleus sp.]